MIIIPRAIYCALIILIQPCFLLAMNNAFDEPSEFTQPLSQGLNTAESTLKEYYYQLVANNYFDASYNNELVLGDINLSADIQHKGIILLQLIDAMNKRNDKSALLLLQRLNKFFALKMHRLLSENDLRQEQSVRMLGCLDDIYSHKVATPTGVAAPFRTLLTKTFIVLAIVNDGDSHFNSRKETMLWHMNKLKHELLDINRQLGEQKIDELIIKDFVTLLAVCETKQPIIQQNRINEIAIKALIVVAFGLILYWQHDFLKKHAYDPAFAAINRFIAAFGDGLMSLAEAGGEGAAKGMMKHIDANKETIKAGFVSVTTEAVASAIPAAMDRINHEPVFIPDPQAVAAMAANGQATRAIITGQGIGAGIGEGVDQTLKANGTLEQAGKDFAQGTLLLLPVTLPMAAARAAGNAAVTGARVAQRWYRGAPAQPAPAITPATAPLAPLNPLPVPQPPAAAISVSVPEIAGNNAIDNIIHAPTLSPSPLPPPPPGQNHPPSSWRNLYGRWT